MLILMLLVLSVIVTALAGQAEMRARSRKTSLLGPKP